MLLKNYSLLMSAGETYIYVRSLNCALIPNPSPLADGSLLSLRMRVQKVTDKKRHGSVENFHVFGFTDTPS